MKEKEKKVLALEAAIKIVGCRYLQRKTRINRHIGEISDWMTMWQKASKIPSFADLEGSKKDIANLKKKLEMVTKEGDELVKLLKDVLEDYKK